jgi:hypothetical protein
MHRIFQLVLFSIILFYTASSSANPADHKASELMPGKINVKLNRTALKKFEIISEIRGQICSYSSRFFAAIRFLLLL